MTLAAHELTGELVAGHNGLDGNTTLDRSDDKVMVFDVKTRTRLDDDQVRAEEERLIQP
jgi:hypothetical protein